MRGITVDESWVFACDSESKLKASVQLAYHNVTPKEKVEGHKIPAEVCAACFF